MQSDRPFRNSHIQAAAAIDKAWRESCFQRWVTGDPGPFSLPWSAPVHAGLALVHGLKQPRLTGRIEQPMQRTSRRSGRQSGDAFGHDIKPLGDDHLQIVPGAELIFSDDDLIAARLRHE